MVYKNETILKEAVTDRSCFPADVLSFSEAALYINEKIELEYNRLFESIGINELAVYESTGELISYVGEDGTEGAIQNKKFHEKVIDFFKKIWGTMKGLWDKAMTAVNKFINDCKSNILGGKLTTADIAKLPDGKKYGKLSDYTEFDNNTRGQGFSANAITLIDEIKSKFSNSKESYEEVYKEYGDKIASKFLGTENVSDDGSPANAVKKYIYGLVKDPVDITKQWLSQGSNLSSLINTIFSDQSIKEIKNSYKNDRKLIDSSISAVKEDLNKSKKDDSIVSSAQYKYRLYKEISQLCITADGAMINVIKKRLNESRSVMFRVAAACHKLKGENNSVPAAAATGESADLFASQIAMVEGAFSW